MSDSCSPRARAARAGARLALTRVHGREAGLGVEGGGRHAEGEGNEGAGEEGDG